MSSISSIDDLFAALKEANERADRNHAAYEEAQGWVKKWAADCGRLEKELTALRKELK